MFDNAINLGRKIFPSFSESIIKVSHEAWPIGDLAIDKNLFPRHCTSRYNWFCHQVDFNVSYGPLVLEN